MAEYISREAAERAAHKAFVRGRDAMQYATMIHLIAKIPAADVVEVVHGEWIGDKSTIIGDLIERNCSLCGQRMTSCIERLMSYCPNCGAKMDGGDPDAKEAIEFDDVFPFGLDDFQAASIINQAFPKHQLFWKTSPRVQIHDLWDALRHARVRCANESLVPCIEWARGVIYKT